MLFVVPTGTAPKLFVTGLTDNWPAKTVPVAIPEVAVPQALLNTARHCSPFGQTPLTVVFVNPLFNQLLPPFVLDCQFTTGVGLPLALALKLNVAPAHAVKFVGEPVTTGAVFTVTVNVGAFVGVVQPRLEVNWQSSVSPLCTGA